MHQKNTVYKYKLQRKSIMKQIQINTHFYLSLILLILKDRFFVFIIFEVRLKFIINNL